MRFPARLEFHEVTPDRWPDFAQLFQARGGPKHCWCSVFRGIPRERSTPALKKPHIQGQVERGEPVGILGYLDGRPVAWCSVAPKSTFARLGDVEDDTVDADDIWSITCFFLPREYRGNGFMPQILQAAIAQAKAHGARVVEAYPVAASSPSYRFMGFVHAFQRERFREVGRAGIRRHIYRRDVRD